MEIVGHGKLGEVALLASIDQQCSTTRLCNLVFMPAWFSPFMFKLGVDLRCMASPSLTLSLGLFSVGL